MGRCKELSLIACLILLLSSSTKATTATYIFNPADASNPTYNDNGDRISGIISQQAHFAFDLSNIPSNATIVSATFSAFFYNASDVPSQRNIWYNSDDSWIVITDPNVSNDSDPGDNVKADKIIGTFLHTELSDDGYVWKTITLTYDGWANDIADGYFSLMITGGQYFGSVGQGPTTFGYNWGVDKAPELTLTVVSESQPITVISPNGGESLQTGTIQSITWHSTQETGNNVKIELYKDGAYLLDIAVSTMNDGEETWLIPSHLSDSTKYKVKIVDASDSSKYDYSNNNFSITGTIQQQGSLQLISSAYLVSENSGNVRIYVSRTGGSSGVASVNYNTSDGTASAGSDYTQASGMLLWADGDTENKYIDIAIINDGTNESDETFTINLKNAIGAKLGNINQATIIITDDDQSQHNINPPQVNTLFSIDLTSCTATLVGLLSNDGSVETEEDCICRFSYWETEDQENIISTEWQSGISQGQNFSAAISGLNPNTKYSFYAQAGNSAGTVNGNIIKFKTYPDPNLPPAAFEINEPNTLFIQNFVKVFYEEPNWPHNNQDFLTYVEKAGNLNEIDYNDVFYLAPISLKSSKIISLISVKKQNSQVVNFYELSKDVRGNNAKDSLLELSIYDSRLNEPNMYSENYLKFWHAKNSFKEKTVTIQKVSSDPNITYPVWDINEIINKNGRKMPLDDLDNQKRNKPYAWFTLSTTRKILDINEDGIVNLADYNLLLANYNKEGKYRSDIASTKNNVTIIGIPDGKVDVNDRDVFITEYNKLYPDNPITDDIEEFFEGFEGNINKAFIFSGNSNWTKSNEAYQGSFSIKSGDIGNNQISIMEITIEIPKGEINFWVKISSESNYDPLLFYIDNEQKGKWTGQKDWRKVSYQIAPGTHTLRWVYAKDNTISEGQDSAWIDNLSIY